MMAFKKSEKKLSKPSSNFIRTKGQWYELNDIIDKFEI